MERSRQASTDDLGQDGRRKAPVVDQRVSRTRQNNVPIATWNNICKAVQMSHTDVSLSNGCSDGDVLTAAWAVAIAFIGRSDNVLFGRVVNGQRALTNNIAHGAYRRSCDEHSPCSSRASTISQHGGPCHRIRNRQTARLRDVLSAVATQDTRSAAYEQPDLDEIATQFVATGLWLEVPNVTDKRRRFTWDSVVAWQDYRRLQAVDDVLPVSDVQTLFDVSNIARGYLNPFASSS